MSDKDTSPSLVSSKMETFVEGVNKFRPRWRGFNVRDPLVASALVGLYLDYVEELPKGKARRRGELMAEHVLDSLFVEGQYRKVASDEDKEYDVPFKNGKGVVNVLALHREVIEVVSCEVAKLRDVPDAMTVTVSSPGSTGSLRVFDVHGVSVESRDAFLKQLEMDGQDGRWELIQQETEKTLNFPDEVDTALTDQKNRLLIKALATMKREVDVKSTERRPNWLDLIDMLEGSKEIDEDVLRAASALTVFAASRWIKSP